MICFVPFQPLQPERLDQQSAQPESLGLSHVDLVQALVALIQDKVLQLVQFQVLIDRNSL
jgi:hypothetical protein